MKLSLVAAAAALLAALPAQAQTGVVRTQLDSAVVLMGREGFVPADAPQIDQLPEGEDEEFEFEFEAGESYIVVAVCDNDCSDLDLVLKGDDGNEIDADREMDDVPMLAIEADESFTGVLSVQMATCSTDTCYFGVRVFRRR